MTRIIFFDGPCRLCNGFVKTILKIDHLKIFKFSSLQSVSAKQHLSGHDFGLDSVIYFDGQNTYSKSDAIVQILRELGGFYSFFGFVIRMIPGPIRDSIYELVARNRYRIFGKNEICMLPPPGQQDRFLD